MGFYASDQLHQVLIEGVQKTSRSTDQRDRRETRQKAGGGMCAFACVKIILLCPTLLARGDPGVDTAIKQPSRRPCADRLIATGYWHDRSSGRIAIPPHQEL